MAAEAQLEWEARAAKPAALAAFASVLLSIFSGVYAGIALEASPDNTRELLAAMDGESAVFVVTSAIQGAGILALVAVLHHLYRVTKFRRADLPAYALSLAVAGPILLALATVLIQLDQIDRAGDFVQSGPRREERADDLVVERGELTQGIAIAGALAFAFALVQINVSAMRAGVLSRFMGTIGVIVGSLYVLASLLPIGGAGFLQIFWVVALGLLFLGRWPGGRGPAWETGEAIPWPSAANRRDQTVAGAVPTDDPRDPDPAPDGPPATKRKRKRKR